MAQESHYRCLVTEAQNEAFLFMRSLMIKKLLCIVLSAQLAFLSTAFADGQSTTDTQTPASSLDQHTNDIKNKLIQILGQNPDIKFITKDHRPTNIDALMDKNEAFFVQENDGPIFGFNSVEKNGVQTILLSAYDHEWKLIDGRSFTPDSNISLVANMANLHATFQSLDRSVFVANPNNRQLAIGMLVGIGTCISVVTFVCNRGKLAGNRYAQVPVAVGIAAVIIGLILRETTSN
jgi:hypothetical protein